MEKVNATKRKLRKKINNIYPQKRKTEAKLETTESPIWEEATEGKH